MSDPISLPHGWARMRAQLALLQLPADAPLIDVTAQCWIWPGKPDSLGYCHVRWNGRLWRAHRYVWTVMRGPIPEGLTLDHLCRVKHCVNPQHLEAVTNQVNTLQGTSPVAQNAAKTHCKRGHPFDESSTRVRPNGGRGCKVCANLIRRERRAELRAHA